MIWKIAKKEFLLNLMTFKFAVGTILCVVLMAVFMPVLVNDYQQRLKDYNENVSANEAELRKVKVYKNITPTIYRPPNILSLFSEGLEKRLGNSAKIVLDSVPEINAASTDLNPYLSIFPTLDVSLIFTIVMSVLAVLVACDTISGEREQGTLKLIVSNTVARHEVLLGKLLAGLMTLATSITIAFIIGLLILLFSPVIDFSGLDCVKIGLIYIVSLIFIMTMYNFGLLFSCLTKRSAISLMFVLLFWVFFLIVIPKFSLHLAGQIRLLESRQKVDDHISSLWQKYSEEENKYICNGACSGTYGAYRRWYPYVCDGRYMESYKRLYSFTEPLKINYSSKSWEINHQYLSNLFEQKYLADNLSRISPIFLYTKVMSSLAGTDLKNFEHFAREVKEYRNKVIDYIRSETVNFSSSSYFTPCKEGDWEEYKRTGYDLEWKKNKIPQTTSLKLEDFPKMVYQPESIMKCLRNVISDLGLLVFANVLFFALSFVAFLRYDVR